MCDHDRVGVLLQKQIPVYIHAHILPARQRHVNAVKDNAAKCARQLVDQVHVGVSVRRLEVDVERLGLDIGQVEAIDGLLAYDHAGLRLRPEQRAEQLLGG